jgi:hypothetical protein
LDGRARQVNALWYRGDRMVDIVRVDAYPKDPEDTLDTVWKKLQAQFNGKKLLAITEFGGVPDIAKVRRRGVEGWMMGASDRLRRRDWEPRGLSSKAGGRLWCRPESPGRRGGFQV